MIPTSARTGTPAFRRRRLLLAPLVAVAIVLGFAAPAVAATPTPSPSATGSVEVSVAPLSGGLLSTGEALTALVSLENGTTARTPGSTAELLLGDAPLDGSAALDAWLSGSTDVPAGRVVGSSAVEETSPGQSSSSSVIVPADDPALAGRGAGVYPLWVSLAGETARSVVTIGTGPSGTVAVIVPITAPPLTAGMLSTDQLATLTASDGALTAELDAVVGTSAILAVDPAIVAAIRARGTSAPASAQAWLQRLMDLPNPRFALQYGDADVSTQFAAGLDAPLAPTSLSAYVDPKAQPAAPTPTPTDEQQSEPAAPPLDALLDVGAGGEATIYWPPSGTASPELVGWLTAATPGAITIVDSTQVSPSATSHARTGGGELLVASSSASTALQAASTATQPTARAADAAAAAAHLTFASASAQGSPVLVTLGRSATRDPQGLRGAISAATTGMTAVGLSSVLGASPTETQVSAGSVDPARPAALTSMLAGAAQIDSFATVLDDPSLLTGRERATILQVLGGAWLSDPSAWQTAVAAHAEATSTTLDSVSIVPSTALNLLTAGTNLRFWVRNDLPYPVNVVLVAAPDDLRVDVERENAVVAAASANTLVEVPVNARIGNGDVKIDLSLRSPAYVPIGQTQTVDVNVRADWEGIGVAALVVLAAGFLTIGVVRTVRRRRRDQPDEAATGDENEEDA
jgi:hypothetical protein